MSESGFKRPKRQIDRDALDRFAAGADDRRAALADQPAPVVTAPPVRDATTPAGDRLAVARAAPSVTASRAVTTERSAQPDPVAYDKHQQIQWRVSQATRDLFDRVYENTNVKSKQQLLDSILLPALAAMDAKIGQSG